MAELAPDLKERFRRDGFVVVPDLLDPGLLDRVTPSIDAAVARMGPADAAAASESASRRKEGARGPVRLPD